METFWGLSATAWTAIYTLLTGGLLVVAIAAALYARRQWKASREQIVEARRAQVEASRPYVIVTAETTVAAKNLFDLCVKNIGLRPAFDVTLRLDPPLAAASPTPGYEMDQLKMLKEPIAMIAPDQEMRAFWDSYPERQGRSDLPKSHKVSVAYSDSSGNRYTEASVIDLAAMEGATYVDSKSIHDIGKTLDKMAKILHEAPILSRNGRAEVLTITETREANADRLVRRDYERLLSTLESAQGWNRSDPRQVAELEAKVARFEATHPWLIPPPDSASSSMLKAPNSLSSMRTLDRLRRWWQRATLRLTRPSRRPTGND